MDIPAANDWTSIRAWRRELRQRLIAARMATPLRERRRWGEAIEAGLAALIAEFDPRRIGFYWPFRAEFDPRPLIRRLIAEGRSAALPAVVQPKTPMEFRAWTPETAMESGIWDIPVPRARDLVHPDLVLAPLVGFDAACYRLGYGGGYFDRTLGSLSPRPVALGVGFTLGRLDTVYPQPFDIPMAAIVTEEGTARR